MECYSNENEQLIHFLHSPPRFLADCLAATPLIAYCIFLYLNIFILTLYIVYHGTVRRQDRKIIQ